MKNWHHLYFSLLIICLTSSLHSQNYEFGLKFGIVWSDITITNVPATHIQADKPDIWKHYFYAKSGFNVSLTGGYHLTTRLYIGLETGYILKGANFSSSDTRLDLRYWNLPMMVKYKVSERFSIYSGPEFSTLLSANLESDGRSVNMDDFYDKPESSVFLGVDYRLTKNVDLGVRYNYGLTKVSQTRWSDESGEVYNISDENNHYFLLYTAFCIR